MNAQIAGAICGEPRGAAQIPAGAYSIRSAISPAKPAAWLSRRRDVANGPRARTFYLHQIGNRLHRSLERDSSVIIKPFSELNYIAYGETAVLLLITAPF